MKPTKRRSGDKYMPCESAQYRRNVKLKVHAHHVFIQACYIAQDLAQYLSSTFPALVLASFDSWLRTIRPEISPRSCCHHRTASVPAAISPEQLRLRCSGEIHLRKAGQKPDGVLSADRVSAKRGKLPASEAKSVRFDDRNSRCGNYALLRNMVRLKICRIS